MLPILRCVLALTFWRCRVQQGSTPVLSNNPDPIYPDGTSIDG